MAAIVYKDRVKETSTTTGTGTLTLAGAVAGFRTYATALTTGDVVTSCIEDGTNWEISQGAYTTSGTTLARTTILASSNSGAAVNWGAGTRNVFIVVAARDLMPPGGHLMPTGALAETFNRAGESGVTTFTPTSGTLRLAAIPLQAGMVITSIGFVSNTTALVLGTSPHFWVALYDGSRNLLRQSTDNTSAAWAASSALATALSSTYTIPTSGLYYIGLLVAMTGGTMPTVCATNNTSILTGIAPILSGSSTSSLAGSAPDPAGAISASGAALYGYVS